MISDKELFDKLAKEDDCWHESYKDCDDNYRCKSCQYGSTVPMERFNPNFSHPNGDTLEWIRERINWIEFILWVKRNDKKKRNGGLLWLWFEQLTPAEKVELQRQFLGVKRNENT